MKADRLLILTSATGGGHDARADATVAWARELYGDSVEVRVCRPLEAKSSPIGNFGVWLYNTIQRSAPWLHTLYFNIIEIVGDFQQRKYIGQKAYEKTLREFRPQLIISLHDFLSRGYFDAAKRILGEANVRCITYCGEYSAGEGFSRHWVSTVSDRWVGRTAAAVERARELGVPNERLSQFAFYLPPEEVAQNGLTQRDMKQALGFDPEKLTILLASGRNGAMDHLATLNALLPYKDRVQLIVVCGLNETLRRQVLEWQNIYNVPMILEGYSTRMRDHMQGADLVFCRGGANTATRAFFEGCPIWFDASEGIMPQEKLTVDFFVGRGAAEVISSAKDFAERLAWELDNPERLQSMRVCVAAVRQQHLQPEPRAFFKELFAWGFGHSAKKGSHARANI